MSIENRYFNCLPLELGEESNINIISQNGLIIIFEWHKNLLRIHDATNYCFQDVLDRNIDVTVVSVDVNIVFILHSDYTYIIADNGVIYNLYERTITKEMQLKTNSGETSEPSNYSTNEIGKIPNFDILIATCTMSNGFATITSYENTVWLHLCYLKLFPIKVFSRIIEISRVASQNYILESCKRSDVVPELWNTLFPGCSPLETEVIIIAYPNGFVSWISYKSEETTFKLLRKFSYPVLYIKFINDNELISKILFVLKSNEIIVLGTNKDYEKCFLIGRNVATVCANKYGYIIHSDGIDTYLTKMSTSIVISKVCKFPVKGVVNLYCPGEFDNRAIALTRHKILYILKIDGGSDMTVTDIPDNRLVDKIISKTKELKSMCERTDTADKDLKLISMVSRCNEILHHITTTVQVHSGRDAIEYGAMVISPFIHIFNIVLKIDTPEIEFDEGFWKLNVTLLIDGDCCITKSFEVNDFNVNSPLCVNYEIYLDKPHAIKSIHPKLIAMVSDESYYKFAIPLSPYELDVSYFLTPGNRTSLNNDLVACLNNINPVDTKLQQQESFDISIPIEIGQESIYDIIFQNSKHRCKNVPFPNKNEVQIKIGREIVGFKVQDCRLSVTCSNEIIRKLLKKFILKHFSEYTSSLMVEESVLDAESLLQQFEIEKATKTDISEHLIQKAKDILDKLSC